MDFSQTLKAKQEKLLYISINYFVTYGGLYGYIVSIL